MKKETKKQIALNLSLALLGGVLVAIAIKCGRMHQAKRIEETTVKASQPSRIDKVSDTDNPKKQEWLKKIYNSK